MSRILFIRPKINQGSGLSSHEKIFPLGIGYLMSVLKGHGHTVDFIDRYIGEEGSFEGYDFIGVYACTPCSDDLVDVLRAARGKSALIVGGPHVSVKPAEIPPFVDYVVEGEGEKVIINIVEGWNEPGYIKSARIQDLDYLPFPDYSSLDKKNYDLTCPFIEGTRIFNLNTSRGCPFSCSFCSVKQIWGKEYTAMSADRIIEMIEWLIKDFDIQGFYFREDNFTLLRDRVVKFCQLMIDQGIDLPWACETRVDTIDEELVQLMANAGCKGFYVGVESGSQKMLDIYNKQISVEQIKNCFSIAKKYGIKTAASMIKKHPQETPLDRQMSEELIKDIQPDIVWWNKYRAGW